MIQIKILGLFFLCAVLVRAFPDTRNPNLEYELISGGAQTGPKPSATPTFIPITRKPLIINTPPPVDPNSKTFAYNPTSKTWTLVKKTDPQPSEDTLLWNQSNDKWLTQVARL